MSSKGIKLCLIGAGSAVFSLRLVKDVCLTEGLSGSHVTFMDIDAERLEVVEQLAGRYASQLGADLTFDTTTDRRVALQDSDFVVNTAAVLGHRTQLAMRDVISKQGYYYGNVNIGLSHNLVFMLAVARDMEQICPDSWLLQAGNPVFAGCTLMTRESEVKVIGLCHGHYGVHKVAEGLGLDPDRVTWQAPGLNHNIWLTHFIYDGKDAYPLLDEWIETKGPEFWSLESSTAPPTRERPDGAFDWDGEHRRLWQIDLSRGAVSQYRMYGLLPIGDTPRRSGWWMHTDLEAKRYWFGKPWGGPDSDIGWPKYVERGEERIAAIARLVKDPKADLLELLGTEVSREQHVPIIDALVNNNEGQFQVNVPNNGVLKGLPSDVVVELPAVINQQGVQPYVVGELPRNIMLNEIYPDWLRMERELHALQTGDRAMLLWNVLDTHATNSYEQAVGVLEEVLAQPENRDMAERYQWPATW